MARYAGAAERAKYPWGGSLPIPAGAGNYGDQAASGALGGSLQGYNDGFGATSPTDSFGADAAGLFNLDGNVAEWVNDRYKVYSSLDGEVPTDPMGPTAGDYYVIRGSSWMHDQVTELRLSYRDYGKDGRPDVGFRLARYAE